MLIKHYFPISVALFALLVATSVYFSIPILPAALVLLIGETLLGFELEDHRVPRLLGDIFRALTSDLRPH